MSVVVAGRSRSRDPMMATRQHARSERAHATPPAPFVRLRRRWLRGVTVAIGPGRRGDTASAHRAAGGQTVSCIAVSLLRRAQYRWSVTQHVALRPALLVESPLFDEKFDELGLASF